MPEVDPALLNVDSLVTGYANKEVIKGVTLYVEPGEIVALLGVNGAGKSTILKTVFGLLPIWRGDVSFNNRTLRTVSQRELLRAGIAYIPQGNRVFNDLTVGENLEIAGITLNTKAEFKDGIDRVFSLFASLKMRLRQRAGTLSGGEKQMLALANAFILSPRLLLLDEPSLGLAPSLMSESFERIQRIASVLDVAILIVEQRVREVIRISHRAYVLRNGIVTFSGAANDLNNEARLRDAFLFA